MTFKSVQLQKLLDQGLRGNPLERIAALEKDNGEKFFNPLKVNRLSDISTDFGNLYAEVDGVESIRIENGQLYTNGDYQSIMSRWQSLGQSFDAAGSSTGYAVRALAYSESANCIYVGGTFSKIGGVTAMNIAKYDLATKTFSAMGSGLGLIDYGVYALAVASDGTLYCGGRFANGGGDANADLFCKWNGSAFSACGTAFAGITGYVYALCVDASDDVYIGGDFTNVGDANGDYVVKWDGANYSSLATGLGGIVRTIAKDSAGIIYLGGAFVNAGGDANADSFCKWSAGAFSACGTAFAGISDQVKAIAVGANNNIYIYGTFVNIGDANGDYIVKWDGAAYSSLGAGAGGTPTGVPNLGFAVSENDVYIPTNAGIRKWNGTEWSTLSSISPPENSVYSALYLDGDVYIGGSFTRDYGGEYPFVHFAKFGAVSLSEILDYLILSVDRSTSIIGATPVDSIPSNGTRYSAPPRDTVDIAQNVFVLPRAGYVKNLYLVTTTAQPAAAGMTCTIQKNGVDVALGVTISGGDAAGTFTQLTQIIYFDAGDTITLKIVNGTTIAVSAIIQSWSIEFQ